MPTKDFNLNSNKNGGKITGFNYTRSLNELVGTWSAEIANGNFKAGDSISFDNVMSGGIITKAYKDSYGLWHLEGKDAGIKLMKTMPDISDLPSGNVLRGETNSGNAKAVIEYLANFCNISFTMNGNGLEGFNVKSAISGSTCAEAILELAMLSGYIAYIDNNGKLNIGSSSGSAPNVSYVINDSGSSIDLDGYATQVAVILNRRNWKTDEEKGNPSTDYIGERPSSTSTESDRGSLGFDCYYDISILQPFNVIKKLEVTVEQDNVEIKTEEEHEYETKNQDIWRGDEENEEYRLWAYAEKKYTLKRTVEGDYDGNTFKEVTTETFERTFGSDYDKKVPEEWKNELKLPKKETITRKTERTGGKAVKEGMPQYAPEYDSKITREYERHSDYLVCNEEEIRYEIRQVGTLSAIKDENGNEIPHFLFNSKLVIPTHSTPQWVPIKIHRTYYEQYDNENECLFSATSEYSDDGAEWLLENAMNDTGDDDLNEYQKSYAKFSQESHGLNVNAKSSVISSPWQFLEVKGRTKVQKYPNSEDNYDTAIDILGDTSKFYSNGEWIDSKTCPLYYNKRCNAYDVLKNTNGFNDIKSWCMLRWNTAYWFQCERAKKILEMLRKKDNPQNAKITIGTASRGSGKVGYKREVYVDDIINDSKAQQIATRIANNILTVKNTKGIRRTITIPYDSGIQVNGTITEVSHDWQNMQTTVTYYESGNIPDFVIPESVSSIATFVSARELAKSNIPKYGIVKSVDDEGKGFVKVEIDNSNTLVSCTTKLKNLDKDDIVLVSFPSGNKLRGQVIARL